MQQKKIGRRPQSIVTSCRKKTDNPRVQNRGVYSAVYSKSHPVEGLGRPLTPLSLLSLLYAFPSNTNTFPIPDCRPFMAFQGLSRQCHNTLLYTPTITHQMDHDLYL